jgi:hypothetical protein
LVLRPLLCHKLDALDELEVLQCDPQGSSGRGSFGKLIGGHILFDRRAAEAHARWRSG